MELRRLVRLPSVLRRAVVTSVVTTDEPPRNFGTFTVR